MEIMDKLRENINHLGKKGMLTSTQASILRREYNEAETELTTLIQQKDKEIAGLRKALICRMEEIVTQQQTIESLNTLIHQKDEEIARQEAICLKIIAEKDAELAMHKQEAEKIKDVCYEIAQYSKCNKHDKYCPATCPKYKDTKWEK